MNKTIGQILLWLGFLSGSLATVFATATFARLGIDVEETSVEVAAETSDAEQAEGESSDAEKKMTKVVLIRGINESSEAFKAGLRKDDQLLAVDGKPTKSASAFGKALGSIKDAKAAEITYVREGNEATVSVIPSSPWSTVNWLWYGISAGVCIAGIVVLHSGKKSNAAQSQKSEANLKQIKANLADAVVNTDRLGQEIKNMSPRQIMTFIEENLYDDLRDFADGRDSITVEHGLETFASVMTQFAAGERVINRAWCAAADGYVDEATRCISVASDMLGSAKKLLESA